MSTIRIRGQFDDKISSGISRIRDDFDRLGKSKGAQSLLMGVGVSAGIMAVNALKGAMDGLVSAVFDTVGAASNQREAMALSAQVFEKNSEAMSDWGDTAAREFGESKTAALQFAANFGTAFKSVGFSLDETSDRAKTMTRLAADLGSAFNTSGKEAATALRSGLMGESEPMRRFGVFLSEAVVQAKALEMGIAKTGQKLTDTQKVAARYAIIMEQTADSQGMFGRDTESLADAQKSLAAEMENLGAEVGRELLPVFVSLAKWAREDGVPALRELLATAKDSEWVFDLLGTSLNVLINGPLRATQDEIDNTTASTKNLVKNVDLAPAAVNRFGVTARPVWAQIRKDFAAAGAQSTATRNEFWRAMDSIVEKSRTSHADLESIVNNAIDSIYDPERRQIKLTAVEAEIAEQRRIIASRDSTTQQVGDARRRIAELQVEARQIQTTQVVLGEATDANGALTRQYYADWAKASGEGRRQIRLLIEELARLRRAAESPIVARFSTIGQIGSGFTHNADGGPVRGGEWSWVGEEGPELVRFGSSGRVYSNPESVAMAGSGGGSPVVIALQLDGQRVAEVVDRHLYYRQ